MLQLLLPQRPIHEEVQQTTSNTAWCGSDAGTGCAAARQTFLLATTRNQFLQPTRYRFSAIFPF